MFSFWLELVTNLERYSSVMCEKLRINPNFQCVFIGSIFVCSWVLVYNYWSAFLWFLNVLLSLIPSKSSRYWHRYHCLSAPKCEFVMKMCVWIALIFLTNADTLSDLRGTTEKIEIGMKELKEKLSSLTTTVEKSTDEGWLLERATHR